VAEDKSEAAGKSDQTERTKRRLRANSETVRERSEKLQQQDEARQAKGGIRAFLGGFLWPLRALGRQIAKLGRFRFFRWVGLVLLPPYIRNSWRELRQVTWPNRKKTFQLTYAVIVFSVLFGLVIAGVDYGLDKLFKEIIVK